MPYAITIFVINVSRHVLNLAPSSSGSVDILIGITKYIKMISYTLFAKLRIATTSAIASAMPAISDGKYKKLSGLTIPLYFQLSGKTNPVV